MSPRPLTEHSKSLSELARFLGIEESRTISFTGVTSTSSLVQPGDLFVALPGAKRHGADFLKEVIASGAVAILTDSHGATLVDGALPTVITPAPRAIMGDLAAWFYGAPSRAMVLVGITGTNGKTTTSSLLHQLWNLADREVGLMGTNGIDIGGDAIAATFTTPEAPEVQSILATMVERHVTHAVMEVSSHALQQLRMRSTHFAFTAFTNLTQDHLDFHGDMESYFAAKAKLFTTEYCDTALINVDDPYGARLVELCQGEAISLSRSNVSAQWHYTEIEKLSFGYRLAIRGTGGILIEGTLPLIGDHNLDNALMAVALACETGLDPLFVGQSLSRLVGVRGRLESVTLGQNFTALIDYAHTPDAVERTLATLRASTEGKLIAVLGCGGDRDRTKRPIMGAALLAGSDIAIFTSDNPRSEDPEQILQEMVAGLTLAPTSIIESDRHLAIVRAIELAQPGDCVVVLGKGHELGQEVMGVKHPFDDRHEVAQAIGAKK